MAKQTQRTAAGIPGPARAPLPSFRFGMEVSQAFLEITKQQRFWNQAGRAALKMGLARHHRERIPLHFRQDARHRYGYQKRRPAYSYIKRKVLKAGTVDLVKKRRLMQSITRMYRGPQFAGKMATGLAGWIRMKIPWPVSRDPKEPGAVTVQKMKGEIRAVTYEEAYRAAWQFRGDFRDQLRNVMAIHRAKRRMP